MKWRELTETFMMISNLKDLQGLYKIIQRCKGYYLRRWHNINPFSAGVVFRRQILTSKDDPRTEKFKIFIMVVDP